jgi:gliding motility-associated-like protein
MKIYNRYGQKIYDQNYCDNAWNGTYNGERSPDGVYAYYIKAWDLEGKEFTFSGTIHLMR